MRGRRFLLLVAVLMGLTALAASVAPRNSAVRGGEDQPRRPTPAPQAVAPAVTSTAPIRREISPGDDPVVVAQGERIELVVASEQIGSVELLDRIEAVHPRSPARFYLRADEPGTYQITLLETGERLGTLVVEAA